MDLVIGATGVLGMQIVLGLARAGRRVRALVRTSSDPAKIAALQKAGAEIVQGDLKQPATIAQACAGVDNLLLTASSTLSRSDGDSIDSVDRAGNLALIDAAKAAGVGHIVFVSFPDHEIASPLRDAKAAVEQAILQSGIGYTILQPPHYWEIWCSPALGFDVAAGKARIYGSGEGQNSWISLFDMAKAAIAALDNPKAKNKVFAFGGPEPLSQREIVRRFEAATGRKFELEQIPEEALAAQHKGATTDLERAFAQLMLVTGKGGWVYDPSEVQAALGFKLTSIDSFIAAATGK